MSRYSNSRYAPSALTHETYATMKDPTRSKKTKRVEGFSRFLYDPELRTVFGRSGLSWLFLIIFYICFYTVLACLFAAMLAIFLHFVISQDEPYRTGLQSPLSLTPGLGMRPLPDFRTNLIKFSPSDPQTYQLFTQNIQAFLNTYELAAQLSDKGFATCEPSLGKKSPPGPEKPCRFNLDDLKDCQKQAMYGYERRKPCVILKMNKIFGWLPSPKSNMSDNVLVKCKGKYDIETEMIGKINYYPNITISGETYGYFSHVYFPYIGQFGYRSPLVAVQFLQLQKNIVLLIKCEIVGLHGDTLPVTFEILYD